ncbi:MAG: hypothetical protein JWN56_345 [Sphingobacteriales bacterium]|nr:hypothetical protein [Sphingobacteriales bacterium]
MYLSMLFSLSVIFTTESKVIFNEIVQKIQLVPTLLLRIWKPEGQVQDLPLKHNSK